MQTAKTKHKPTETCKNVSGVSVHADVHNLVRRTAQNIFDNLPDLPPDNHYYSGVEKTGDTTSVNVSLPQENTLPNLTSFRKSEKCGH